MDRILISACLIGQPVRYDGAARACDYGDILQRWTSEGRLVPVCPEVAVGFPTPRPPAEIQRTDGTPATGPDVAAGRAVILEKTGQDVTQLYLTAATQMVALAKQRGCRHAVLTDGSPSCGSSFIYDGSFSGIRQPGMGTTTTALRSDGVQVWAEHEIPQLDAILARQ